MMPDEITSDWESVVQYGHMLKELGWVFEPKGKNYATHQRTAWFSPAKPIDSWDI